MTDKKSYLQKMADQLEHWDAEIDELKAKADKAQAESRTELHEQINDLRAKKETAQRELKKLQNAGDDTWDDIKTGFEKSWTELKDGFSKAYGKFK